MFHETDSYGSISGNGSWSGMIALVSSGVADIGIGHCSATRQRYDVVAFVDTVEFAK